MKQDNWLDRIFLYPLCNFHMFKWANAPLKSMEELKKQAEDRLITEIIEERKKKNKENGWIYLGELEYSDSKFTPTSSDSWPFYLYTRYNTTTSNYHYAIAGDFSNIGTMEHFISKTPMSVIGFLKSYISHDMDFGRLEDGSHVGLNTDNFKIRLRGMNEWVEGDAEYRKGGSYKDMEERLESDKIKFIREKVNNPKLQLKW